MTELRRALPFLLLPLLMLAMGCNLLPPDLLGNPTPPPARDEEAIRELEERVAAWEGQAIDDYVWVVELQCRCPEPVTLTVRVEDGVATDIGAVGGDPISTGAPST